MAAGQLAGSEDSATTAHIENEAVSEHLDRVRQRVRCRLRSAPMQVARLLAALACDWDGRSTH